MADTAPLSSANRVYLSAKEMAVGFRFKPGERINEGALAKALNASRTPVREALNRLVAERLLDFRPGKGFFCRNLDAKEIFDLYELRAILEVAVTDLCCERASDGDLAELDHWLRQHGIATDDLTLGERVERDEKFHEGLARLSGNAALHQQLTGINERIRFVRWLNMEVRVAQTKKQHLDIMAALMDRDAATAGRIMRAHISQRLDQITATLQIGFGRLYMEAGAFVDQQIPDPAPGDDENR